jgi:hypothetical protein
LVWLIIFFIGTLFQRFSGTRKRLAKLICAGRPACSSDEHHTQFKNAAVVAIDVKYHSQILPPFVPVQSFAGPIINRHITTGHSVAGLNS